MPELRTEIWQGWIYVTLNPDAPPVAELLKELEPEVARYGNAAAVRRVIVVPGRLVNVVL